jgi:hypothetical protein
MMDTPLNTEYIQNLPKHLGTKQGAHTCVHT